VPIEEEEYVPDYDYNQQLSKHNNYSDDDDDDSDRKSHAPPPKQMARTHAGGFGAKDQVVELFRDEEEEE